MRATSTTLRRPSSSSIGEAVKRISSWSEKEDSIIRARYGKRADYALMSELPGRTWRAIQARSHKIGAAGFCPRGRNVYREIGGSVVICLDRRDGSQLETVISLKDLDSVLAFGKWRAHASSVDEKWYARSGVTFLHRFLLGCARGEEADHKDGDTLNNRRSNLRKITHTGNAQNRSAHSRINKTGHRNVYWHPTLGYWVSAIGIRLNGKRQKICRYSKSLEEALQKAAQLRREFHPFHLRTDLKKV